MNKKLFLGFVMGACLSFSLVSVSLAETAVVPTEPVAANAVKSPETHSSKGGIKGKKEHKHHKKSGKKGKKAVKKTAKKTEAKPATDAVEPQVATPKVSD